MNLPDCTLSMKKMSLIAAVRMLQSIASYEKDIVDAAFDEIKELEEKEDDFSIFKELPPLKPEEGKASEDDPDDDHSKGKADE